MHNMWRQSEPKTANGERSFTAQQRNDLFSGTYKGIDDQQGKQPKKYKKPCREKQIMQAIGTGPLKEADIAQWLKNRSTPVKTPVADNHINHQQQQDNNGQLDTPHPLPYFS